MPLDYNNRAKKALALAAKASKRLRHSYVGTEHLLLGLLLEEEGVASKVLSDNGVRGEDIERLIEDQIALVGDTGLLERDGYTPKLKDILEGAETVADSFKALSIGTEHIL